MSLSVDVVRNLGNNKVLIKEKSGSDKKPVERYYIAQQENADKFIAQRKTLNTNNKFQHVMTYVMSAGIGLLVGAVVKFGTLGKVLSGAGVGLLALISSRKVDKMMDKRLQQHVMKNYDVEDVTGQKPEDIK